jgi:hypothetical protein
LSKVAVDVPSAEFQLPFKEFTFIVFVIGARTDKTDTIDEKKYFKYFMIVGYWTGQIRRIKKNFAKQTKQVQQPKNSFIVLFMGKSKPFRFAWAKGKVSFLIGRKNYFKINALFKAS